MMTGGWSYLLVPLAIVLLLLMIPSCAHITPTITHRVYVIQGDALVRKQANESIPFRDAQGYLCAASSAWEAILLRGSCP
jgi:hypothetical protein